MKSEFRNFQAHSVPFGGGADGAVSKLAVPSSNFHKALTGTELSNVFGGIADGMGGMQQATKEIYTRVAGAITSKVQDKLVHDFL
jgi:hypothetical protein